ncbi:hypothetical protein B9T62_25845 [Paenibacillus donghaensis]|uniref:Uncharacterized protein n=1 Tax=Paenibacillus donghaensis TaxID=414771 RepID=A0A2Z2KKR1_9BACL|nr:hypothetical protein B9T62_25845 [Paenibacillus donghaensis]
MNSSNHQQYLKGIDKLFIIKSKCHSCVKVKQPPQAEFIIPATRPAPTAQHTTAKKGCPNSHRGSWDTLFL